MAGGVFIWFRFSYEDKQIIRISEHLGQLEKQLNNMKRDLSPRDGEKGLFPKK
jgi:hypothetical protein